MSDDRRPASRESQYLDALRMEMGYGVSLGEIEFEMLLTLRHGKIQEAAYFKAERRGFVPGHELDDWLAAEREVDEAARPVV